MDGCSERDYVRGRVVVFFLEGFDVIDLLFANQNIVSVENLFIEVFPEVLMCTFVTQFRKVQRFCCNPVFMLIVQYMLRTCGYWVISSYVEQVFFVSQGYGLSLPIHTLLRVLHFSLYIPLRRFCLLFGGVVQSVVGVFC